MQNQLIFQDAWKKAAAMYAWGTGGAQDNRLFIPDGKAMIKMEQQAATHPSRAEWVTFCCRVSDVWR